MIEPMSKPIAIPPKPAQIDPSAPLFGRAFQSSYPPASTFKPVVALAAIDNGSIHPDQTFDCPYKIKIGRKWFHNHSEGYEGWVDARPGPMAESATIGKGS